MEYIVKNVLMILFVLLFISCNVNSNQSIEQLLKDGQQYRIENKLKEAISIFKIIIENYPGDDLSAEAQFQIADIFLNDTKDFEYAVKEFKIVVEKYPNHEVAKKSLFLIAYIYNNYINAYSDAMTYYKLFKIKYPNVNVIMPEIEQFKINGSNLKWNKNVGEVITEDEIILEIEIDNNIIEVSAPASGILLEIIPKINDIVVKGDTIARIGDELIPSVEYELDNLKDVQAKIDTLKLLIK